MNLVISDYRTWQFDAILGLQQLNVPSAPLLCVKLNAPLNINLSSLLENKSIPLENARIFLN